MAKFPIMQKEKEIGMIQFQFHVPTPNFHILSFPNIIFLTYVGVEQSFTSVHPTFYIFTSQSASKFTEIQNRGTWYVIPLKKYEFFRSKIIEICKKLEYMYAILITSNAWYLF